MKRTLIESLVDYEMALLRAVAEVRGAELTTNHRISAAEELVQQLSAPASLAIALADLSPAEREALAALQRAGGWIEANRFARSFGEVRIIGPGRLEREKPWLSSVSPAEGLWYRALIFKGFRQAEGGVVEVVYVPNDLLAILPDLLPGEPASGESETGLVMEPAIPPPQIRLAGAGLIEDIFSVLVTVRNRSIRLRSDASSLQPKDLQTINALCKAPLPAARVADDDRLALIVYLPRAANLLTVDQGRPTLRSEPAKAWLQASPAYRLLALQRAWRDDPDWNELWRVPTLKPQPTGWKNDPILARRYLLKFLAGCHPGEWYRLDELKRAVKASSPDFQRPNGDYDSWYIHNLDGESLMGFEHWDEVEGALLHYLVSGPLHWLGVTDLGLDDTGHPTSFRLADTGLHFLNLAPPLEGKSPETASPALIVRDDFSVHLPLEASLYTRFQLARFADLLGREAGYVSYRLSPTSLARARRQDITLEQIRSFLTRTSGDRVPNLVLDALRSWHERSGSVRLEQGVVLRVDRPETLKALRQDPGLAHLLNEVLGPQAVLVPRASVQKIRRWLMEQGYLEGSREK